jgi:quinoprotein glucose dehydrogenase
VDRLWPRSGQDASLSSDADHAGERQDLVVVGTYHTAELTTYNGTLLAESAAFEATPLMVDGVLYLVTATNRVVALDAVTGAERWVFDPKIYLTREYAEVTSRGVSTWVDLEKESTDAGYRRL